MLKLLLPAFFPSWNFFDVITASPRIQYALLHNKHAEPDKWVEFRPRPTSLSLLQWVSRLIWNAKWNETLFVVSCAERLLSQPTQHSENEIFIRMINDRKIIEDAKQVGATYLQFRLLTVERLGTELCQEVVFHSQIRDLSVL